MYRKRYGTDRVISVAIAMFMTVGVAGFAFFGLPPVMSLRAAVNPAAVVLGVDAETAVVLDPEIDSEAKFGGSSDTTRSVDSVITTRSVEPTRTQPGDREILLVSNAKAVAPIAVKKKAVTKTTTAGKNQVKATATARPKALAKPAATKPAATSSGAWKTAKVSWYGPGLYGNTMAGGGTLQPGSMVVAHRTMAFGTRIEFKYGGKTVIAVVRDRGPHVSGRVFDLGPGTAKALGFSGVGVVSYRILGK